MNLACQEFASSFEWCKPFLLFLLYIVPSLSYSGSTQHDAAHHPKASSILLCCCTIMINGTVQHLLVNGHHRHNCVHSVKKGLLMVCPETLFVIEIPLHV